MRIGGTKYQEQYWEVNGFALRQPVVQGDNEARDMTDIASELAARTGLTAGYIAAINKGAGSVPLKGVHGDFSLDVQQRHSRDAIWDAVCRAASAEVTEGKHAHGLEWWKENGLATKPLSRATWYLDQTMVKTGLRYELPYQERLLRVGTELGRRLHEHDMHWWDEQLKEYQALPIWKDFPGLWEAIITQSGERAQDYPFWLLTARSMQYAWGANAGIPLMHEVADNITGHRGVIINSSAAEKLGIADGDAIEISTPKRSVRGNAVVRQGIRPDTLLLIGQFEHWETPVAKDFGVPSLNTLATMSISLTDATGSGADIVRVKIVRAKKGAK